MYQLSQKSAGAYLLASHTALNIMRNGDKPGHKPAECTCRGFQDILKVLLGRRNEQFVGTLKKGHQVASIGVDIIFGEEDHVGP